jgi:transposase
MDRRIEATVRKTGTSLTSIPGVGPFIAAKILGEVRDPSRVRSKPAFAVLSGTAPLSASSGQVQRHRLNRGGNRQLNWALHHIALVQCRIMPEAQAYMDRQREGGQVPQRGHALPEAAPFERGLPSPRRRREGGGAGGLTT